MSEEKIMVSNEPQLIGEGYQYLVYKMGSDNTVMKISRQKGICSKPGEIWTSLAKCKIIAPVIRYGDDYLMQEYIDGWTLKELFSDNPEMTFYKKFNYNEFKRNVEKLIIICDRKGLSIKDIDENNLMIDKNANIYIVDPGSIIPKQDIDLLLSAIGEEEVRMMQSSRVTSTDQQVIASTYKKYRDYFGANNQDAQQQLLMYGKALLGHLITIDDQQ